MLPGVWEEVRVGCRNGRLWEPDSRTGEESKAAAGVVLGLTQLYRFFYKDCILI